MSTVANETTFVQVGNKKTQVMRGGSGPPLLYLHSAGGETDWMPFHDRLAQHFTVYAPAHPGFALSKGLEEIEDIHDYAWHYVDLLAQLQLDSVPVVGFSLGGWIGVELSILRPELVRRLVMVDSAGLRVEGAPVAELFLDDFDKMRNLLFFDPHGPAVEQAMPTSVNDPRMLNWLRAREATARVGWNPYLHNPRLPRHLHRVRCPVALLWGDQDRLIPVQHGEYFARHLPRASLSVFPDCGHMLPFEECNRFVEETVEFLSLSPEN